MTKLQSTGTAGNANASTSPARTASTFPPTSMESTASGSSADAAAAGAGGSGIPIRQPTSVPMPAAVSAVCVSSNSNTSSAGARASTSSASTKPPTKLDVFALKGAPLALSPERILRALDVEK